MASGRRNSSDARSFDFASDDVLCSYDEYAAHANSNGKDFHETRGVKPLVSVYSEDERSKNDMIHVVERCMKNYADNLLQHLEGIRARLSQLEVNCYKIERCVGELRAVIDKEHGEADGKLKSLEKHLQEVHRSVQILRDKQELAETQKELSKLQVVSKETTSSSQSNISERSVAPSVTEKLKLDDGPDAPNYQLALALPSQIPAAPTPTLDLVRVEQHAPSASLGMQQDHYALSQASAYSSGQPNHHYVHTKPHTQDLSSQRSLPQQSAVSNQNLLQSALPRYAPQWSQHGSQQGPQQVVQLQQQQLQTQIRPQTPPSYSRYPSQQPANRVSDQHPNNANIQASYSVMSPPGGVRSESVSLSYGGPGYSVSQPAQQQCHETVTTNSGGAGTSYSQQLPQHHIMHQLPPQTAQSSFDPNMNKSGYLANVAYSQIMPQPGTQGYNTSYDVDGGRAAYSRSFHTATYPTNNMPGPNVQQIVPRSNMVLQAPQAVHTHPYADMIEKAINMGYSRDHVLSVMHMMADSNQHVDFNAFLDRLNARSSGSSPRAW